MAALRPVYPPPTMTTSAVGGTSTCSIVRSGAAIRQKTSFFFIFDLLYGV
jgi:hypothetical protein